MKLPAAERAVIAPAKIRDYRLSTSHPVGRFKAPFFASLGYTIANWPRLEEDLAVSGDAELGKRTREVRNSCYSQRTFREVCGSVDGLDNFVRRRRAAIRHCFPGGNDMMYKLLDTVVLDRDLPEHGLRNGDLGAVVEVYAPMAWRWSS